MLFRDLYLSANGKVLVPCECITEIRKKKKKHDEQLTHPTSSTNGTVNNRTTRPKTEYAQIDSLKRYFLVPESFSCDLGKLSSPKKLQSQVIQCLGLMLGQYLLCYFLNPQPTRMSN